MLSHESVWGAIDALAAKRGVSASALAKSAGLDPTTFNKSKRLGHDGRPRWPSTESLAKIIAATGSTLSDFMSMLDRLPTALETKSIQGGKAPVMGFAQAGAGGYFDDAGFPAGEGWEEVDYPGAAGSAYALKVAGDSMLPLYRDGDTIIVSPMAPVRKGDRVVAKTKSGEVMAKILHRQTGEKVVLSSLNPEHSDREFRRAELDWIARITWASQ
jgi:phage repressor protein C with HTH and peptisase S24 domain